MELITTKIHYGHSNYGCVWMQLNSRSGQGTRDEPPKPDGNALVLYFEKTRDAKEIIIIALIEELLRVIY